MGRVNKRGLVKAARSEAVPDFESPVNFPCIQDIAHKDDRLYIFAKKLRYCCQLLNFGESPSVLVVQRKVIQLHELAESIYFYQEFHTKTLYEMCATMFACNVFRTFPKVDDAYDPEEEGPLYEIAWPHLQYVYNFMSRCLESPHFNPNVAKTAIDKKFVFQLINTFASEDINELQKLRHVLYAMYAKFCGLRPVIREAILYKLSEVFCYKLRLPGTKEILDLAGSITIGLKSPVKAEHELFLLRALLPLHFTGFAKEYFAQLSFCVVQFFKKDSTLVLKFMKRYLKKWPRFDSKLRVLLIGQLEEIIDAMPLECFRQIDVLIYNKLAECIRSEDYEVAKRALLYWDNDYIISLMEVNAKKCSGILLPNLLYTSKHHWNKTVVEMSVKAISHFLKESSLPELVDQVKTIKMEAATKRQSLDAGWTAVEDQARRNSECIPVPILEEET